MNFWVRQTCLNFWRVSFHLMTKKTDFRDEFHHKTTLIWKRIFCWVISPNFVTDGRELLKLCPKNWGAYVSGMGAYVCVSHADMNAPCFWWIRSRKMANLCLNLFRSLIRRNQLITILCLCQNCGQTLQALQQLRTRRYRECDCFSHAVAARSNVVKTCQNFKFQFGITCVSKSHWHCTICLVSGVWFCCVGHFEISIFKCLQTPRKFLKICK